MVVKLWPLLCTPLISPKISSNLYRPQSLVSHNKTRPFGDSCLIKPKFKCYCIKDDEGRVEDSAQGFSVVESDIPWENGDLWSSLALYLFSFHVPLSFGGLSVVSSVLHQQTLDPQTQAFSLFAIQVVELIAVIYIPSYAANPQYKVCGFFQAKNQSKERNSLLASVLGIGLLLLSVLFTSIIADQLLGSKDVNNPILKQIFLSGPAAGVACILVYCVVTPLLEEIVYRGFLLTSLSSEMKWRTAVAISSVIFSLAHFSSESFLQLFVVGSVLGCSYCWTGNLRSSFLIHSLYNALVLSATVFS